jgi:hypothetical protein
LKITCFQGFLGFILSCFQLDEAKGIKGSSEKYFSNFITC